jgi:hypothetical protein
VIAVHADAAMNVEVLTEHADRRRGGLARVQLVPICSKFVELRMIGDLVGRPDNDRHGFQQATAGRVRVAVVV